VGGNESNELDSTELLSVSSMLVARRKELSRRRKTAKIGDKVVSKKLGRGFGGRR
jgi:hypothetical protein